MPGEGFEPPTFGLQNRCTTTVLTRQPASPSYHDRAAFPPLASLRVAVYTPRTGGAIAQLGERLNGIQEVGGSIPLGSTNNINRLRELSTTRDFCRIPSGSQLA